MQFAELGERLQNRPDSVRAVCSGARARAGKIELTIECSYIRYSIEKSGHGAQLELQQRRLLEH